MLYLFWRVGLSSGIYSVNILLVYFLALGFILLTLLCSLHPPPPFFLQGAFLLTTIKEHQPGFSFFWGLFPLYFKKPFYDKITRSSIFFWVTMYITYVTSVNYIQRVLCKTFMCLLYITKQYAPPTFFFLIYFYCRKVCVVYIFFLITFSSHHRLGLYLTTLPLYRYRLLSKYHLYAHCQPYLFKFR